MTAPPKLKIPPPWNPLVFGAPAEPIVEPSSVRVAPYPPMFRMPPPQLVALLTLIVDLVTVKAPRFSIPPPLITPPPPWPDELPLTIESAMVMVAKAVFVTPPPPKAAVLPDMVELVTVAVPQL